MVKKKEIWGLKVVPNPKEPEKHQMFQNYDIEIAQGTWADPLFFTSPTLREIIGKNGELKKFGKTGSIEFSLQGEKVIQHTYPFSKLGKKDKLFIGKGVGTGIEEKALAHLEKRFGNVTIEPSFGLAGEKRIGQLKRRNVKYSDSFEAYSIKIRKMRDAIKMAKRRGKRIRQKLRRP